MHLLWTTIAIVFCVSLQVLGVSIFIRGFLPIKQVVAGHASHHDAPPEPSISGPDAVRGTNSTIELSKPVFGRLVLVLIDALRWDFVLGEKRRMPFVRGLIDRGQSLSFIAKAQPPTVTMPRVKALTSGTIPGFVDVILNVDSKAMLEDNIIYQLEAAGKKMHFFGDDTWLRLFPDSFKESDGTTSFFVSDYTEVDNNVTRHLEPTLARSDWDVLILHYLGLDHIGHIGGPSSPLVTPKLEEMDAVLTKIYTSIEQQDAYSELPSLLVLCGDHGMSEAGSHGGASPSETLTPLILLSSKFKDIKGSLFPYDEVQQIDMAPSLAVVLGLPIPQNSLGIVIPEVLNLLPMRQRLRALQLNSNQLMNLMKQNFNPAEFEDVTYQYQHALQMHAAWLHEYSTTPSSIASHEVGNKVIDKYLSILKLMQLKVSANITRYDIHAMICGIVLCFEVIFIIMVALFYTSGGQIPIDTQISKMFYFGCCCLATLTVHVTVCTSSGSDTSPLMCGRSLTAIFNSAVFVISVAVAVFFQISVFISRNIVKNHILSFMRSLSTLEIFLLLGSDAHTISLMSSSFVEEEHQTWYLLTMTLLVGICAKLMAQSIVDRKSEDYKSIVLILMICRLLRSWNQTGIKWADLPDIGDWLVRPENVTTLSSAHLMSLVAIYIMLSSLQFSPMNLLTVVFIYLYRHAVGNVLLPVSVPSSYKGIVEARIVFGLLVLKLSCAIIQFFIPNIFTTFQKLKTNKKSVEIRLINVFYESFILLAALLLRPHNTPVVAMTVFIQQKLIITLTKHPLKAWSLSLVCFWMGQAAFYNQGNSNSIASIDLSSGYVGLDSHDPAFVGVLLLVSTNFGPVSWMIILIGSIMKSSLNKHQVAVPQAFLSLMLFRAFPLAVYTIVVASQRYHLFIWSVFSPKLLYEAMHSCVLAVFIMLGIAFYVIGHYTRPINIRISKRD
ncbi:GPI ethanolamine phosphate transferase 2-like [Anneissia japonica]|uniref:GPI ethanolamine phosphate transferase 2-like n=1 Tax=Anneissia japonica TaxID=1529436 RepID=UPI00142555BD|nr:GPI ethanolamine phosphate transferase 2-like [Anneissia japonica]